MRGESGVSPEIRSILSGVKGECSEYIPGSLIAGEDLTDPGSLISHYFHLHPIVVSIIIIPRQTDLSLAARSF